jgi:WXG100 family type VII secretion target
MVEEPVRPGPVTVAPSQLAALAGQFRAGAESIDSTLSQLAVQISVVRANWLGRERARLEYNCQQWQSAAGHLTLALDDIASVLGRAAVERNAGGNGTAGL